MVKRKSVEDENADENPVLLRDLERLLKEDLAWDIERWKKDQGWNGKESL